MYRKVPLAVGIAVALGGVADAQSAVVDLNFSGWMTIISPGGVGAVRNPDYSLDAPMYGYRTPINGTLSLDTILGNGTGTIQPFSFGGSGLLETSNLTLQAIGDGFGGPGTLVLGNWTNDWNGNIGTPRSIVWDATGLYAALSGVTTGDVISGGAVAATEGFLFSSGRTSYTLPIGAGPLVTTSWNTTTIDSQLGTNPSGTLPLTDDGIGGSPDVSGPTQGFNYNFDVTSMQVTAVSAVPVPAAIWLFGAGLGALVGLAGRERT